MARKMNFKLTKVQIEHDRVVAELETELASSKQQIMSMQETMQSSEQQMNSMQETI